MKRSIRVAVLHFLDTQQGDGAYAADVAAELRRQGFWFARARVHPILRELEEAGFLTVLTGPAEPMRGNRRRRKWRTTLWE